MTRATCLVVIYATVSKILRRKIIVNDNSQLDLHQPGLGESWLLLPLSEPFDDTACRAAIAAATGVEAPSGRCCIIDQDGDVVGLCNADPALDTHPTGQLVAHDLAGPGDRYRNDAFMRKYAVIDKNGVASPMFLSLDNPTTVEASSVIRASGYDAGSPKAIASAPP